MNVGDDEEPMSHREVMQPLAEIPADTLPTSDQRRRWLDARLVAMRWKDTCLSESAGGETGRAYQLELFPRDCGSGQ